MTYCPSQEQYELRLEQNWLKSRHIELKHQREHEEVVSFMEQWATNKGSLEEEIQKKTEMLKYGSSMGGIG